MWDESAGLGGEDLENQMMLSNFSRILERLPNPLEKKKFRRLVKEAMYVPMGQQKATAVDKDGKVIEKADAESCGFKFIADFGKLVVKKFGRKLTQEQLIGVGALTLISGWNRLNHLDERELEALLVGVREALKDLGMEQVKDE